MSVQINDRLDILTAGQEQALASTTTQHRIKVLTENPTSKPALTQMVHDCVDAPTVICIGVSPALRYTWTEIGTDAGIHAGDFQQIGRAGNADFKAAIGGDPAGWANGIQSIIARAEVLTRKETSISTGVVIQEHQTVVDHGVSAWPFVVGFGALAVFVGIIWSIVYRQQKRTQRAIENAEREAAEWAGRNIAADQRDEFAARIKAASAKPTPAKPVAAVKAPLPAPEPFRGRVVLPTSVRPIPAPAPPVVMPTPVYVAPAPMPTPAPYRTVSRRDNTPAPRRRDDTPAPSSSYSSGGGGDFFSSSGGGGGGDIGGSFSGGGGGGDF